MKRITFLALTLTAIIAHADPSIMLYEVDPIKLKDELRSRVNGNVLSVAAKSMDSISFTMEDATSTPTEKKIDTYTCSCHQTPVGADIIIQQCEGKRTVNGQPETGHSKPTLQDISKDGGKIIRLIGIVSPENAIKSKWEQMNRHVYPDGVEGKSEPLTNGSGAGL